MNDWSSKENNWCLFLWKNITKKKKNLRFFERDRIQVNVYEERKKEYSFDRWQQNGAHFSCRETFIVFWGGDKQWHLRGWKNGNVFLLYEGKCYVFFSGVEKLENVVFREEMTTNFFQMINGDVCCVRKKRSFFLKDTSGTFLFWQGKTRDAFFLEIMYRRFFYYYFFCLIIKCFNFAANTFSVEKKGIIQKKRNVIFLVEITLASWHWQKRWHLSHENVTIFLIAENGISSVLKENMINFSLRWKMIWFSFCF